MTFNQYMRHYLNAPRIGMFFALSLIALIVILAAIFLYARSRGEYYQGDLKKEYIGRKVSDLTQRFYELIFSGTSILFFLAIYYLIDRFLQIQPYRRFWDRYDDLLLLLFICLSIFVNHFLDHVFVPLSSLSREEKASIRLVGMVYIILIFAYIKFIYEDNNYDAIIMYFIGLMIGRFVYFDASLHDFLQAARGAAANFPLLILVTAYTGMLCLIGFHSGFLLTSNGVIVSIFIAHLFMDLSIFLIVRTRLIERIC